MGGPKGLRPLHKKKYPRFSVEISKQHEKVKKYTGEVLPVDILVLLRSLGYYHKGEKMPELTGREWVEKILQWVSQQFIQQFAVVALVMDNHANVPPYKAAEENKRSDERKKGLENAKSNAEEKGTEAPDENKGKPYPHGSKLTEQGVLLPEEKEGAVRCLELVGMERLLASRGMRSELLELVCECLKKYGLQAMGVQNAIGKFLIVDYSTKQRKTRGTAKNTSADWKEYASTQMLFTTDGHSQLPQEWQHPFGEADNACIWYAHIFRKLDCVIDSNDTDMYNSCLSYLEHESSKLPGPTRRTGRLRIRYRGQEKGKTDMVCLDDMAELYACMQADKISASLYGFFHGLGGNDYSKKNQISDRLSVDNILKTVQSSRSLIKASKLLKETPNVLPEGMQFVWYQVRYPELAAPLKKQNKRVFDEVCECLETFLERVPAKSRPKVLKGDRVKAMEMVMWSWQYFYMSMFWMASAAPFVSSLQDLLKLPLDKPSLESRTSAAASAELKDWIPKKPATLKSNASSEAVELLVDESSSSDDDDEEMPAAAAVKLLADEPALAMAMLAADDDDYEAASTAVQLLAEDEDD